MTRLDEFVVGRRGIAVEETHIFTPGMANTIRFGYNRSNGDGQLTPKAINPAGADPSLGLLAGFFAPRISMGSGVTSFRGGLHGQSVQNYLLQTYQFYDDASRNAGRHSIKFGGMFIAYHLDLFAPFVEDGSASFSGLANFLTNNVHRVSGPPDLSAIKTHHNRTNIFAGYVQDDWHIRPRLTLNLGLRYEMETIPTETSGLIANLPTIFTDPSACVSPSNCPGFNKSYFTRNPTTKNFEPRVGFAWDPFGNGKTAVRGGVGLFDALPLPYELVINNAQTSPFHVTTTTPVNPGQGLFPHGLGAFFTNPPAAAQTWNYVDTNIKRNYVYQWNLNVQHQFPWDLSVMVAYAGSRGVHNPFQLDDINTVYPTLTQGRWLFPNPVGSAIINPTPTSLVPGQLINPNVSAIQTTLWESMSYYNALQLRVEKRLSHGLQVVSSFTWSKTMDTSSGSFAGDNFASNLSAITPWWDLKLVRGLSDFNVGRNLTVNVLWDVPAPGAISASAAGWLVKGWQLGGIFQASDGVPFWPLSGLDGDPMGQLNSAPIAIPDRLNTPGCTNLVNPGNPNNYVKEQCLVNAQAPAGFNLANCDQSFITNFAAANPGQSLPANTCINLLGNLGRNTLIGPGLINVDFSVVKNTRVPRISENFNIQFRTEFFNVLNHANFAPPNDNLLVFDSTGARVPGFGQITSTQTPGREIQFALKLIW